MREAQTEVQLVSGELRSLVRRPGQTAMAVSKSGAGGAVTTEEGGGEVY